MTAYQIDVHHHTHTCPANPDEPHPYDTRRTVIAIAPGGPCRHPITIHCADTTAVIDCHRHLPHQQQCPACRTTVIEHAVTFTHHGHHGPQHPTNTGTAA